MIVFQVRGSFHRLKACRLPGPSGLVAHLPLDVEVGFDPQMGHT